MGLWEAHVAAPPFSGAAVLVTGAGTGIGAHACLELAKAGWVVVATVFDNAQKEAMEKRAGLYKAVHIILLDVTSLRSIEAVRTYVTSEAIPLVALVNNAAVVHAGAIEYIELERIEEVFRVVTLGSIAMTQQFLPVIRKTLPSCKKAGYSPKIVNISSGAAIFGQPMHGPYTIAKTALEAFSDVLRRELRPQGIQVVVVQPSAIKTKAYGQWEAALNELWKTEADKLYGETKRHIVAVTRVALKSGFEPQVAGRRIASAVSLPSSWSRVKIGLELWFLSLLQMLPTWVSDPFWEFILRLVVKYAKS